AAAPPSDLVESGDLSAAVACNLANAAESDLRPRVDAENAAPSAFEAVGGRSLWFYLTLLATGLIAAEWWLYQRRIVG
ncbi:MAG: hypothetical protein AAF961_04345, partial [Planctomycetota bacterium]